MSSVGYAFTTIPVPSRRPLLEQAVFKLGRPVSLNFDTGFIGPAFNMVRALEGLLALGFEYLCVMQDDIVLSENFSDSVEAFGPGFLQRNPGSVLSFYSNTVKYKKAVGAGASAFRYALTETNFIWVYSILMPFELARQFIAFYHNLEENDSFPDIVRSKHKDRKFISSDSMLSYFLRLFGYSAFCTSYSLVQHAGGLSSSLGHNFAPSTGKNVAPNFIGVEADARKFIGN